MLSYLMIKPNFYPKPFNDLCCATTLDESIGILDLTFPFKDMISSLPELHINVSSLSLSGLIQLEMTSHIERRCWLVAYNIYLLTFRSPVISVFIFAVTI
ncbi:UNVERIFIED_CONTAM: hypothetical protein RMT77_002828 [Armadillidium vulgare]